MQAIENTVIGLVLAAGKGSRMGSALPKVLFPLAGQPLLERVYGTLQSIGIEKVALILSAETAPFSDFLGMHPEVTVCIQHNRLGTGDAVAAAYPGLLEAHKAPFAAGSLFHGAPLEGRYLLICYGDTPCLDPEVLKDFIKQSFKNKARLSLIGMTHPTPKGYGRLVLDAQQSLVEIVEEKDADDKTRPINICNTGILFGEISFLFDLLGKLDKNNAQGEYYLTDCFQLCRQQGEEVFVYMTDKYRTFGGVNTQAELAELEAWFIREQHNG